MNELLDNLLMDEWANQSLPRSQERKLMSISLRTKPGDRLLELGGGACPLVRPNCDIRACTDTNGNPTVDIVADFEQLLPFANDEWDGIFCRYALEHISFHKISAFLKEVFRICKVGAKVVFVIPNTEAQLKWIQENQDGWDGKPLFEAASELLYGTLDYEANSHKAYLDKNVVYRLFMEAGFRQVTTDPYNERGTDLVVQAIKPNVFGTNVERRAPGTGEQTGLPAVIGAVPADPRAPDMIPIPAEPKPAESPLGGMPREQVFDKHYFNGGGKVGGYAREGYWDYPVHWVTFNHVLAKRPTSVLELGCGRGYILKRLEDVGIPVTGLEISKHCWLTRAVENVVQHDLCNVPWPVQLPRHHGINSNLEVFDHTSYDLCFSIATFEHIPEEFLPRILDEMKRTCKRGLHGIDFGDRDDGFDKSHVTLKPYEWWRKLFDEYGLQSHDIVDKEELEKGSIPLDVRGDGKCKLAIGTFTIQSHHGWINIDVHDLHQFAQQNGYLYRQHDIRTGIPYKTGEVDLIHASHFLEHLTAREGLAFLRDCRRVLKPSGAIRLATPDAWLLTRMYLEERLGELDEISDGSEHAATQAGKLWELLFSGHQFTYDRETLCHMLQESGFNPELVDFRQTKAGEAGRQTLRETLDGFPCLSVFCEGVPSIN